MYRTSHPTRILSAALSAIFGLGLVATAGGALPDGRSVPAMQLVKLDPVIITPHSSPKIAAACEQMPKAAL